MKTIIKHTIAILLAYLCSISLVRAANPECTSPLTSDSSTNLPESPGSSSSLSSTVLVYKEQKNNQERVGNSPTPSDRFDPSPRELPMPTKSSMGTTIPVNVAGSAGVNDAHDLNQQPLNQTRVLGPVSDTEVRHSRINHSHYQNALFTETNLGYDARLNDSIGTTRIAGIVDQTRRLGRVPDIELRTRTLSLARSYSHQVLGVQQSKEGRRGVPVQVESVQVGQPDSQVVVSSRVSTPQQPLPRTASNPALLSDPQRNQGVGPYQGYPWKGKDCRGSTAVPVQVVHNVSNPDPGSPVGYPKRDGIPVLVEYLPNHGKQGDRGYPCTGDSPVLRGVPVQVGQSDDQVVVPSCEYPDLSNHGKQRNQGYLWKDKDCRGSTAVPVQAPHSRQPLPRTASNPALLSDPQGNQGVGPYQGYPQKGKIQVPVKVERARKVWEAC